MEESNASDLDALCKEWCQAASQNPALAKPAFIRTLLTAFPDPVSRREIINAALASKQTAHELIIHGTVCNGAEKRLLVAAQKRPLSIKIQRCTDKVRVTANELDLGGSLGCVYVQICATWDADLTSSTELNSLFARSLKDEGGKAALYTRDTSTARTLDNGLIVFPLAPGLTSMPALACSRNGMNLSKYNDPDPAKPNGARTKAMRIHARLVLGPAEGSQSAADYVPLTLVKPGSSNPFEVLSGKGAAARVQKPGLVRTLATKRRGSPSSIGGSTRGGVQKGSHRCSKGTKGEKIQGLQLHKHPAASGSACQQSSATVGALCGAAGTLFLLRFPLQPVTR
jgi:hypothetical protein